MEYNDLWPLFIFVFCVIICPLLMDHTGKSKLRSYVFWLVLLLVGVNVYVYCHYASQINAYEDALAGKKPLYAATQEERDAFDAKYDEKEHELDLKKEQHVLDLMNNGMSKEDAEEKADDDFNEQEVALLDERLDKEDKLGHTPPKKKVLAMLNKEKASRQYDMIVWSVLCAAVYSIYFGIVYGRK